MRHAQRAGATLACISHDFQHQRKAAPDIHPASSDKNERKMTSGACAPKLCKIAVPLIELQDTVQSISSRLLVGCTCPVHAEWRGCIKKAAMLHALQSTERRRYKVAP